MKVVVLGASGLVGATVFEHLRAAGGYDLRPVIHSTGNAGRLARHGIELATANVLVADEVRRAVAGASHVINCTAGTSGVLIQGMKNILAACRAAGVERLVHLSSVMVYGDRPAPASVHEDAPPAPSPGYGRAKLRQDRLIAAAARRGLPVVVLCIPNVSGPYCTYLPEVLGALRAGTLPLVEDGALPVNLVDARNVAVALERALTSDVADGRRMFVTDGGGTTWRDLVDALMPLADDAPPPAALARAEALALTAEEGLATAAKRAAARILQLDEVKQIVKSEEALAKTYRTLAARFETSPPWLQRRMTALAGGRSGAAPVAATPHSGRLILHQLRGVRHSIDRAGAVLGYVPRYDFVASMASYRDWYRVMYGHGGRFWDLYRALA